MLEPKKQYLTALQLDTAAQIVVDAFDHQMKRMAQGYPDTYLIKISSAFIDEYHKVKLASFFTLQSLDKKIDIYFTDEAPRDFLLGMTQIVATHWAVDELGYDEVFVNTIVRGVITNKPIPDKNYSLMDSVVIQSLYVQENTLVELLTDNPWLTVLYLLMQHMDRSVIYKAVITKAT